MRLITFFIAAALAAVAAVIAWMYADKGDAEKQVVAEPKAVTQQVQTVDVLVARDFIPIGTILEPKHFDRQSLPQPLVNAQFVTVADGQNEKGVVGMVTRAPFQPREPLLRSKLANPNDPGFLAGTLPEGMRAVTVPIDGASGVSSFVYPGDKVDILLTRELIVGQLMTPTGPVDQRDTVTEVIVPNAKVLAVDTRATAATEETPKPPATMTFQVSPLEVQKLRLANRQGVVSVALRSLKDQEDKTLLPPVTTSDLSRITKRSHFESLFDPNATYDPKVVNPYTETAEEPPSSIINIFRGAQKQTVGVTHP